MITCGWFLTDLAGGGAERIPLVIAPAMRTSQVSVVLLKHNIQHQVPPEGPQIITLSSGDRSLARAGAPILVRAARLARRFDVLVSGLEWAPTFFTAACGALSHTPVVATIHADLQCYHQVEPVPPVWWTGMRRALQGCAAIVAVSEGVRRSLLELGLDDRRIHVISPPGPSSPITRAVRGGRPRILTVAGLKPIKGVDVALEAAAKLSDLDFEWTIVGDGPEGHSLRRRAQELGVSERVKFVGFQPTPEAFYSASDLYVLPSRSEGAPLVIIEALTAGLPIVATRCGAGVEGIVTGDIGELVQNGDADALAGGIRRLLSDPGRRQRLGDAARERAREYEPRVVADRYDRLLAAVAEGQAPTGHARSGS